MNAQAHPPAQASDRTNHSEEAIVLAQARSVGLDRAVEQFPDAVLRAHAAARRYAAALDRCMAYALFDPDAKPIDR